MRNERVEMLMMIGRIEIGIEIEKIEDIEKSFNMWGKERIIELIIESWRMVWN